MARSCYVINFKTVLAFDWRIQVEGCGRKLEVGLSVVSSRKVFFEPSKAYQLFIVS